MIRMMKSKKKTIFGIVTAVVLLAVITVLTVNIKEITVTGNNRYTSEQIINMLFSGKWDRNSFYCLYKDRFKGHQPIPFVEDYKIEFKSLTKIEIIIYEKSVVAYVPYMGSYMYFDKDGIIVESANKKLEGVPMISGLKFGHIALHKPLAVEDEGIFEQIMNLTQELSSTGVVVDKIQYDRRGNASLDIGGIEVILGDGSNMSGKISKMNDMLPALGDLSGTLYLDTYDEANPGKSYRFVKRP